MEKIKHIFFYLAEINVFVSITGFLGLAFGGNYLYQLWTHSHIQVDPSLWILMGSSLIFFSVWRLTSEVQTALNQPWVINITGLIASVSSCLVMYLTIHKLGLVSAGISALMFEVIMALYLPCMSLQGLESP